MFIFTVHHHKEGKRRRNMNKSSIEQCEKEIHRLQSSVDILRQKLEESELKETSDSIDALANQSDNKIRSIISRYVIFSVLVDGCYLRSRGIEMEMLYSENGTCNAFIRFDVIS